ncbi:hypothetical protein [Chitinophaga sp.]|uniref:hypothetical protein n=1 Tax=Chitinophaga sp. TaxID=1869181 RepID=UPI0031D989D9
MNKETVKKFNDINIAEILGQSSIPDSFKENAYKITNQLSVIHTYIQRATAAALSYGTPAPLTKNLEEIVDTYLDNISFLKKTLTDNTPQDQRTSLGTALGRLDAYYSTFFEISSGSKTMPTISAIICSSNSMSLEESILEKNNYLNSQVEHKLKQADDVLNELSKKASEEVVSNYAKIFEKEELANKKISRIWFISSISIVTAFIIFIIISSNIDLMNIYQPGLDKSLSTINYSNLVSKIIVVSIGLYLISFNFKQFSIAKHLQTVNSHRKNALNSYKLFSSSINSEDMASRNALMLQVAKAIYEYNTTGYLSSKQAEGSNSGFFEITKFVSENKGSN